MALHPALSVSKDEAGPLTAGLEQDKAMEAALVGRKASFILEKAYR